MKSSNSHVCRSTCSAGSAFTQYSNGSTANQVRNVNTFILIISVVVILLQSAVLWSISLYFVYFSVVWDFKYIDDQHRNPNISNRDHLIGQQTNSHAILLISSIIENVWITWRKSWKDAFAEGIEKFWIKANQLDWILHKVWIKSARAERCNQWRHLWWCNCGHLKQARSENESKSEHTTTWCDVTNDVTAVLMWLCHSETPKALRQCFQRRL